MPPRRPARIWYLAMESADALRPARAVEGVEVRRAEVPFGPLNRFFYLEVGRGFHWVDRRSDSAAAWQARAERVETWLAWVRGTPAGIAELLVASDGSSVDVAIFGVLPPFRGAGVGGRLLTEAVRRAWMLGPARVTVNTCELDGPHALDHYLARGFAVRREAVEERGREPLEVVEMRSSLGGGEADVLAGVMRRASLVWDAARAALEAHPEVFVVDAGGDVRVAVGEDDRVLGFSVVVPGDGGSPDAVELDGLFVEPSAMGLGVGRALIDDVVARAAAAGASRIDVVANPEARGFYARMGFTGDERVATRFGPAVRMSRPL